MKIKRYNINGVNAETTISESKEKNWVKWEDVRDAVEFLNDFHPLDIKAKDTIKYIMYGVDEMRARKQREATKC